MRTYVFSYRNPLGYAPTPETSAAWRDWFDGMGEQLVDLGQPVASRASVGNCASDSTELGGYSLISAPDLESAVAVAKGCPHLARHGGVEVGELTEVPAVIGTRRRAG